MTSTTPTTRTTGSLRTRSVNGATPASDFQVTRTKQVTARYTPSADALYLRYGEGDYCFTAEIAEGRYLDYSTDGRVLGVEVLDASQGVELEGLPFADEVARALGELGLPTVPAVPQEHTTRTA
jgi:uncharacterized protein YuzE